MTNAMSPKRFTISMGTTKRENKKIKRCESKATKIIGERGGLIIGYGPQAMGTSVGNRSEGGVAL